MRFIKLAIISVFVLFLLTTALGLLLPSTVRVTRNITVHTPHDSLYNYINDMSKWKLWIEDADSVSTQFLSENTAGNGAVAMIGKQKVAITKATRNEIRTVWYGGSRNQQLCVFQLSSGDAINTNLNWYFEQKLSWFPWQRLPAIANDKILGPFMEHSLDKLKAVAEKNNLNQ